MPFVEIMRVRLRLIVEITSNLFTLLLKTMKEFLSSGDFHSVFWFVQSNTEQYN